MIKKKVTLSLNYVRKSQTHGKISFYHGVIAFFLLFLAGGNPAYQQIIHAITLTVAIEIINCKIFMMSQSVNWMLLLSNHELCRYFLDYEFCFVQPCANGGTCISEQGGFK